MALSYQFKAFDTEIMFFAIDGKKDLMQKIEKSARDFEKKFSRFDETSELNKINNRTKPEIKVSAEMLEVLMRAKTAYRLTKGVFDPAVYSALCSVGYDESFDLLKKNSAAKNHEKSAAKFSFKKFKINSKTRTIKAPLGLKIDLGGIAKGFWVDKMKKLLDKNCENYWINAGGDIFLKGKNEFGENWQLDVQNPLNLNENLLSLSIPAKGYGVATSGVTKRQGIRNGKIWNHLIDTRTNLSVKNSILAVTVIAKSVVDADVLAKTVLILGVKAGLALVNSMKDYECVIIDKNLKIIISRDLKKFL